MMTLNCHTNRYEVKYSGVLKRFVVGLFLGLLMLCIIATPSRAAWTLPNATPIFTHSGYNYGPSIIVQGTTEKIYWCGYGTIPGTQTMTDVIFYRSLNLSNGSYSPITQVLWPTPGQWDGTFTCDPSVIAGKFVDKSNGQTYSYALYYTATNQSNGVNNAIGVAFSNDGVNWTKYGANPVIAQQGPLKNTYGAGQAATYSYNGQAGLYLFHTDTSVSNTSSIYVRSTSDGITFNTPTLVSNRATDGTTFFSNADFAYNIADASFYAAVETSIRSGDRESYEFGIYKLGGSQVVSGNCCWTPLARMNTALSGFYLNHSPGIIRDQFGNLYGSPNLTVLWAGGSNDPNTWNLTKATLAPTPISAAFVRYYDYAAAKHLVTTGYVVPGYLKESTLGYLYLGSQPNSQPLYGCLNGGRYQFVSPFSSCEGSSNPNQGILGYIFKYVTNGAQALYRCYKPSTQDHFVSPDPKCEGQITELGGNPLGYAPTTQQ